MVELHRRDVLEQVGPERRLPREVGQGRHEMAVHQRPGVVGEPGVKPRHQRTEADLQQTAATIRVAVRRSRSVAGWLGPPTGAQALGQPDRPHEGERGRHEMQGQEVLRHFGPLAQARLDHEPADQPLQPAQREQADELRLQARRQSSGDPEADERQRHDDADAAAQQAVRPFPVEDRLEPREIHVGEQLRVLRDRAVFVELGLPGVLAQRRHDAHDGLPFRDGQARLREPGRAAHHHHQEDAARHGPQPTPNGTERTSAVVHSGRGAERCWRPMRGRLGGTTWKA